jgi:hypothetical protein
MREKDFMRNVINLAKLRGWRVAHFGASVKVVGKERIFVGDRDSTGFPDLVLVRKDRLVFAELKAAKGRLSDAQKVWLEDLGVAVSEVYLWYPQDMDVINTILT